MPRREEQLNFNFKQKICPPERELGQADPAIQKVEARRRGEKKTSQKSAYRQEILVAFDADEEWPKKVFLAVQSNPGYYLSESDEVIVRSILQNRYDYVTFGAKKYLLSMCKKIAKKLIE
ncbi:MAG: hypothetical protein MUC28_03965 [Planctomycetes bacterium]|jgi:hypothetical protein|nr:hypothetical protein [Planctomycetota bacterium]